MPDAEWISGLGLSTHDQGLLASLISPNEGVDVSDNLAPEELWSAITTCFGVYSTARKAQGELKAIIGRLLIQLESHPQLYQERGYRTYDDFISQFVPEKLGVPRSEAYRIRRLVKLWPQLSPAEFAAVGEAKLHILSTFTSQEDPQSSRWLEAARGSTKDELLDQVAQAGEVPKDMLLPAIITIATNVDTKKAWKDYSSNSKVQSTVGTSDLGSILLAMIAETSSSWGI